MLEVNVLGMVNAAHAIAPGMTLRKEGTLIFLASVAGQIGSQTDPPYSASKAANINFAQCLAKDLAPHGIRVNVVCPGMVRTPLNERIWQAWNDQQPPAQRRSTTSGPTTKCAPWYPWRAGSSPRMLPIWWCSSLQPGAEKSPVKPLMSMAAR